MNIFTNEEIQNLLEVTEEVKTQMILERMQAIENIYALNAADNTASFEENEEVESIYSLIQNFYDKLITSFMDIEYYIKRGSTFAKIDIRTLPYYDRSYAQRLILIFIKNNLLDNIDTTTIRTYINDDYTLNNKQAYYRKREELFNIARKTNPFMNNGKSKKKKSRNQKRIRQLGKKDNKYHSVY